MKIHEKYMSRAIQIAQKGRIQSRPNPSVGCVVVLNDCILSEAHTSSYGGAHAEVNALKKIPIETDLSAASLYVTLEPCNHFGKTPPCSHYIVERGVKNVIIGMVDPNPLVAEKGIAHLRKHGVSVQTGVLEKECQYLHRHFTCSILKKRPYIHLKWAQSTDGFIAPKASSRTEDGRPFWISNAESKQFAHLLRTQHQAILIGSTTLLRDNAQLNVRLWKGPNPLRVIFWSNPEVSDLTVFKDNIPTLLLSKKDTEHSNFPDHIEVQKIKSGEEAIPLLFDILAQKGIQSILVEGGSKTLISFIESGLYDEITVIENTALKLQNGIKAPVFKKSSSVNIFKNGSDLISTYHYG